MENKWGKRILGLVAVGAAVGGVIAYLDKKNNCCNDDDEFADDFENEDFDLDEDLKEATSREYVSLTPDTSSEAESVDEETQSDNETVSDDEEAAEDSSTDEPENTENE